MIWHLYHNSDLYAQSNGTYSEVKLHQQTVKENFPLVEYDVIDVIINENKYLPNYTSVMKGSRTGESHPYIAEPPVLHS